MTKRLLQTSVSIGILLQYLRSGWVSRQVVTRQSSSLRQSPLPILNHSQMVPFNLEISSDPSLVGLADGHFHPFKQLHLLCVCRRIFVGMWVNLEGARGATVGCGPSYPNVWVCCDGRPGGELFRLVLVLFGFGCCVVVVSMEARLCTPLASRWVHVDRAA
jgi:hypothetical protein